MNMFRRFLLLAVCAVGLAGAAHAEDFRVAMVNVDRLMREAAPAKAARERRTRCTASGLPRAPTK